MPEVSVIIPVYNVQSYLSATLDSVLGQSFTDFEVVCVDNGSTDGSAEVLSAYASKDARVKVLHQSTGGVSAARNAGLDAAQGEYVAFLDSDDLMHPRFLEVMLSAMQKTQADLAYCKFERFQDGASVTYGEAASPVEEITDCFARFVLGKPSAPGAVVWNKLYRAELFKTVRLPEEINKAEDLVVTHSLLYAAKKTAFVADTLVYYRIRQSSLVHAAVRKEDIENGIGAVRLLTQRFKDETLEPHLRRKLNYRLMKMLCKDCIVTPYKQERTDKGYLKFWESYRPLLSGLKREGLYRPEFLDLRNRLFSFLFLSGRFGLLRLCLKCL